MKRRILLVDDEVAVLLTLKAVLEISGFDVDTAASAREGKSKLRTREYHMIITDMRMESDQAGREVIAAARAAVYHPAIAMLTAFPVSDEDWQEMGADKMLVKPMHTRVLLEQIEKLLASHEQKLSIWSTPAPSALAPSPAKKPAAKKSAAKKSAAKKPATKMPAPKKATAKRIAAKTVARKLATKRNPKSR
ncbi:MAG: response regulator [Acidobacteriota bacterium]|nr:response regulator [Acidobacteriota bacterium]